MLKNLLLLVSILSTLHMFSQNKWGKTTMDSKDDVVFIESHMPSSYHLFTVDVDGIKSELQNVLQVGDVSIKESSTILSFPNEYGELQRFKMLEASIMEDELALKFPMIKTYIGQGVDDPTATLRMSIGTDGLHVMVLAADKTALMIDPYTKNRNKYIVYASGNLPSLNEFVCEVKDDVLKKDNSSTDTFNKNAIDGKMRQYRLAVACTVEYSVFHLNNQGISAGATLAVKKAAVLSAIVNTVNRVSGIYEKEIGVKFVLIGNNSNIIFIDSDSFTNNNANLLIAESQTVITNTIGVGNFDVGHTFSTGGGGLATLGSICYTNAKARGITGSLTPIGDFYDVDYVAHEMGHQFGANHTFNTTTSANNCGAQRNTNTAGEPGGGTTIMAYAGICPGANVQANSDVYFHHFSLQEIYTRITSAPTCATITNTGNNEPTANAGVNKVIPKGTAYILEGQSNDPDGDTVTYCWEQVDTAHAPEPLVSTATVGPAYRSLLPTTSPNRYMPAYGTVLGGSLQTVWEVTPTVGRQLNFRLTTRDNRADGGQSNSDTKQITVSGTAGPFIVTSQTASETWNTGESKTIAWNVAGTTANGVNTANVEISLVDSNGTVLTVLSASTPNDGSATITVPSIVNDSARIMVKSVNNIFYAINNANIGVNAVTSCTGLCTSVGNGGVADGTRLVVFNTINNASTANSAFSDYTNISTTVVTSNSYDLTVHVDTDGPYTEFTRVWIDWNRDCVFNTTDEQYDLGSAVNVDNAATSLSPLTIVVPAGASLGDTIMRVSSKYNGYPTSCETLNYGEVEDYTVTITSPAAINEYTNFTSFVLSPNPNNGEFSIELYSDNANDISVKVFDVIGRQVYNKSFNNNQSVFNANVNLGTIQPGMYLVNVSDGIQFNTEKIIIK